MWFFVAYQLANIRAVYASFKTTGALLLSVIVNRIELARLPFSACAWHGRGTTENPRLEKAA